MLNGKTARFVRWTTEKNIDFFIPVVAVFSVFPASSGALVTISYLTIVIIGFLCLVFCIVPWSSWRLYWILIIPGFLYFFIMFLSVFRSDFVISDLGKLNKTLIFVTIFFSISFFSLQKKPRNMLLIFIKFAPFGAIPLLFWIVYYWNTDGYRISGGTGNPIPFAMICSVMTAACIYCLLIYRGVCQITAALAVPIYMLAIVFSGTRSVYLTLPVIVLIAILYRPFAIKKAMIMFIACGILAGTLGSLAVLNSSSVSSRFSSILTIASSVWNGSMDTGDFSSNIRIDIIGKGLCYIYDRPIWGYGISNRKELIGSATTGEDGHPIAICQLDHKGYDFTHFHNGFVSSSVDAGLFGLLAVLLLLISPLLFSFFSEKDDFWGLRLNFSLVIVVTYFISGSVNLLFGHALIDTFFLVCCLLLATSLRTAPGMTSASNPDLSAKTQG